MEELLKRTLSAVVDSRYPEMTPEGQLMLEGILIRKDLAKGERLIDEGEISRHFVFVAKGMIRQFYFKNGKDITEHFSYEGCVMMCIESLFREVPSHLIAEALEPSVVYLLPMHKLQLLMDMSREVNIFYQRILEFSLINSQEKADSWRFETAKERYNRLFNTHPEVIKRAPLSHIASYLLMTPETLSRVRSGIL